MAKTPWKPWHEVVALRDDLKSGELPLHMPVGLYEVMTQIGISQEQPPESVPPSRVSASLARRVSESPSHRVGPARQEETR
jgi:hypothetical protein